MSALKRFNALSAQALIWLAAFGLLAMTAIISWQVFGRFILKSSPSWTEQAALTLMIWYVMLAAAAGVREGFHIQILAVRQAVSQPLRERLEILAHCIVALCALCLVWFGCQLVLGTWNQAIPGLGLPRGVAYIALPISGLMCLSFLLEVFFDKSQEA